MANLTMNEALKTSALIASIKNALAAITELDRMQIAVLSVQVKDAHPRITVRDSTATRKLKSFHSMRGQHNGQYVEARFALVNGCTVEWRRTSATPFTEKQPKLSVVKGGL